MITYPLKEPIFKEQEPLTVSELNELIKDVIESNISYVRVWGEISNFSKSSKSGHLYFNLKDDNSIINCVMWAGFTKGVKFEVDDGLEIIAYGRVGVYEKQGRYQLYVESIEPKGIGILQLRYEQLKAKLQKEGLFDEARKKSIPFLPEKIAVVTSLDGAAIHDITDTIQKRFPSYIVIFPVSVQGEEAAQDIADAIVALNQKMPEIDVMIVGRGGGSMEDLWPFNEEVVVRAIANSKIPVISAVGHETDYTLSDFVADLRAKTPTDAGNLVVPEYTRLMDNLARYTSKLDTHIGSTIAINHERLEKFRKSHALMNPVLQIAEKKTTLKNREETLDNCITNFLSDLRKDIDRYADHYLIREPEQITMRFATRLSQLGNLVELNSPAEAIRLYQSRIPELETSIHRIINQIISTARQAWQAIVAQLEDLNPLAVLRRGYSITKYKGKILLEARNTRIGEDIETQLHQGKLRSKITDIL